MYRVKGDVDIQRLPVDFEEHKFHDWTVSYKKSHILHSQCVSPEKCAVSNEEACLFCV